MASTTVDLANKAKKSSPPATAAAKPQPQANEVNTPSLAAGALLSSAVVPVANDGAKTLGDQKKSGELGSQAALSTPTPTSTFDILTIPFYRAVNFFENEDYQNAIPLFLESARNGNLYAPFYLQYLASKESGVELTTEQSAEVKHALEYIQYIPKDYNPQNWLKASLCIMKINRLKKNPETNISAIKRLLAELLLLGKSASNASIAYVKIFEEKTLNFLKLKAQELSEVSKQMLIIHSDLNALYYFSEKNPKALIKANETILRELENLKKYLGLINKPGAIVEGLISCIYKQNENRLRVFAWVIASAHLGNKKNQFEMAKIDADKQDLEKIKQTTCWLLMAALNNEPQAQFSVAIMFYYGNRIFTPNMDNAREFFEKCIPFLLRSEQDLVRNVFANSLYEFAKMHELGKGGLIASDATAVKYYQEAANREDPRAHLNLGHFYATGRGGLPKDYTKAVFHYNNAIEIFGKPGTFLSSKSPQVLKNELAESHYNAGLACHRGGFGLSQNYTLAAEHFRKASSEIVKALFMYGLQLYMGQGINVNKKEGLKLLIAAADKGLKIAAVNLMTFYFEGEVIPYLESNFTKEQLLKYMLLAKDESPWIISKLALYYLNEKNYKKADEYIQLGVKLEQAEAIGCLAYLYEKGCPELKISQDYKIAYEHNCRAAELGCNNAKNAQGYMLLYGLGVNKDEAKAKLLFEQCLAAGLKLAAYNLSAIYRFGLGVTRDLKESFKYLGFAEACDDEDVLFTLGYCLCQGEGTEPDYKRGQVYIRRAAEKGHVWASFNCAIFCLNEASQSGSLDDKTSQTILKYLEVPAAHGYARAIYLRAMVKLYQQPSNIKAVIGELEASERVKPYTKTKFVLQFLKEQTQITKAQVLNILFAKNILSIKDIEIALNPVDSKKVVDVIKGGAADRKLVLDSTLTSSGNGAAGANSSNQTHRLKSAIDEFSNPLQRKNANVDALNSLVGRLFKLKGITAKISSSNGSGVKYRVEIPNSEPICYSYHPTHTSGSASDARMDPKRGRDMQKFVDEIRETLAKSHS